MQKSKVYSYIKNCYKQQKSVAGYDCLCQWTWKKLSDVLWITTNKDYCVYTITSYECTKKLSN